MARESAQSWRDAAYATFVDRGLRAIRIEALARDLGATKGSFYWHFGNRGELVSAVMARWEREETDRIIELADVAGSPRKRLETLYRVVGSRAHTAGGESTLYTEAADEGVDAVVERVSQRRIAYIAGILAELGVEAEEAELRATVALAGAVGLRQLTVGGWRSTAKPDALIETMLAAALGGLPPS
ncbi:MAG TPA: TetR/AcrR family transcriptional regulator [Pseudonocardia sp.]